MGFIAFKAGGFRARCVGWSRRGGGNSRNPGDPAIAIKAKIPMIDERTRTGLSMSLSLGKVRSTPRSLRAWPTSLSLCPEGELGTDRDHKFKFMQPMDGGM